KLLSNSPQIIKTIRDERNMIKLIVKKHAIDGIISDNRFGVFHPELPSVFITHQLKVLSGNTTWLSTKLHQKIIKQFDECWIPDVLGSPNLSGEMGHIANCKFNIKYIGPLSRYQIKESTTQYEIKIMLSGPKPQRDILEQKLLFEFRNYHKKVLFVRGVMEKEQTIHPSGNLTIYNFMTTELLQQSLNSSNLILARSGYTTLMDLAKLRKKAFFIPTPGQFEQVYLAKKMQESNLAPFCYQE